MGKLTKFFKILRVIIVFLMLSVNVTAVSVVKTTPQDTQSQVGATAVLTIFIIGIIFLFFILIFVLILLKIFKSISDTQRKKKDFYYQRFLDDDSQCNVNRDTNMKYRNWKFLWIFFKRHPVYVQTSNGLEMIGLYNGETQKKENYYCISIYNKLGIFKYITQVVIIPNKIKHLVSKIDVAGKKAMIINADGVDEFGNTDYYLILLLKNPKDDKTFVDYSDEIQKSYFEKVILRDVIKENLQQYRENIIESIEANPYTQFNRRKD